MNFADEKQVTASDPICVDRRVPIATPMSRVSRVSSVSSGSNDTVSGLIRPLLRTSCAAEVADSWDALGHLAQQQLDALPFDRSGRTGTNRADQAALQITAGDDLAALSCFLQEYEQSVSTHRVYSRECERLILWAWHERAKPFSSLDRQDFEAYLHFLQDPQPAHRWCGKKVPRQSEQWRPFVGPLQQSAVMSAISSINSFVSYLVDAGYLRGNPLGLIRQRRRKMLASVATPSQSSKPLKTSNDVLKDRQTVRTSKEADKVERYLDVTMWQAVNETVEARPRKTTKQVREYERARFILSLLFLMAPRAGDLEKHTMSSFKKQRGLWWWHVVGKGDKAAKLPVPEDMVQALFRYRAHLGLPPTPAREESTPLMCSIDDSRANDRADRGLMPIKARRLNQILKSIFVEASERMGPHDSDRAEMLKRASAHWGRHTAITRMDDAGMEARLIQKSARHSDPRTTQMYIHDDNVRWHAESQRHKINWVEGPGVQPPDACSEQAAKR